MKTQNIKIFENNKIELIEHQVNNFLQSEKIKGNYYEVDIKVTKEKEELYIYTVLLKKIEE